MGEMIQQEILTAAGAWLQSAWRGVKPEKALICGSGWGAVQEAFTIHETIAYSDIPGWSVTGVDGHQGVLCLAEAGGIQTLLFLGRRHWYEGQGWTPVAMPVYLAKVMGASHLILTNAAGGVNTSFSPGDLMCVTDHVNGMGGAPLIGPYNESWGVRFPDMSEVYHQGFRGMLQQAADAVDVSLKCGVYYATSGPCYETPAEVRAIRNAGGDAVGMSTVPEAVLARAAGLNVTGISCISNLAAGVSGHSLTHDDVISVTRENLPRMTRLIGSFWAGMGTA